MKKLAVVWVLTIAGIAWGQNDLPLQFKGTCDGNQTDIRDLSAIQETPAIKCNALVDDAAKREAVDLLLMPASSAGQMTPAS